MSRRPNRAAGRRGLELVEAAVHLLRTAPAGALLCYYVGSIPAVLGLLYFWADMVRGAYAQERLAAASLGAAGWFLWMKCWQTAAASKWRSHLLLAPEAAWSFGRILHLILVQAAVQPSGLLLRPLAAQLLLPYVWTYSFYQNATVLGDGSTNEFRPILRQAAQQARLWPGQAHLALLCLFAFAFFIWLNVMAAIFAAPFFLHTFFGIETPFSRSPFSLLNSTTLLTSWGLTYLCFDPIRKALFVLRCFHGASLRTGEDLLLELHRLRKGAALGALAVALFCASLPAPARAAEPAPPTAPVSAEQLDGSLDRVLQRREFAWRLPRVAKPASEESKGWLVTFAEEAWKRLTEMVRAVGRWLRDVLRWFERVFRRRSDEDLSHHDFSGEWSAAARWSLVVLALAVLTLLGVLLWRFRRWRPAPVTTAEPLPAVPDLEQANVSADLLPEDGWLRLARELLERGEPRLALRAFYLAGLAHLGQRELVLIARHKSNRDYQRELRRRARQRPEVLEAFSAAMLNFESAWYGDHPVTDDSLSAIGRNLETIRAC